jgi:septal ring factor EnvC (AmiA/AmiB activator)
MNVSIKLANVIILPLIMLAAYLVFPMTTFAQTNEERMAELKIQIEQLELEAQKYRNSIASEQSEAKSLQAEITSLKNQVGRLENQITLTGKKIDRSKIEISGLESNIFDTQESIDYRKNTIGELLSYVNRSDSEPILLSLIKNQNISDFLSQQYYARTINSDLLDLVVELRNEKTALEKQKTDLEGRKADLEALSRDQSAQRTSLSQTKSSKDNLLKITKGQEAQYQKMLQDIEIKKSLFFTELKEIETNIIQGGLYLVHIKADSLPKRGTMLFTWPEERKRITQQYGMTPYARSKYRPYGGAPHNGLDMAIGYGSQIHAIGDGEIIANGKNDGWGNWVAIKHPISIVLSVYMPI